MPYDNSERAVTRVEYDSGGPTFSYATFEMVPGVDHTEQLEVEFVFTEDANETAVSSFNLTMNDKRALFLLPNTDGVNTFWDVNEDTKQITFYPTPINARPDFEAEDNVTTVEYPDFDLSVDGQKVIIRRATVNNELFTQFVTGTLTPDRLQRNSKQWIFLIQEILDTLENDVLTKTDLDASDGPIATLDGEVPLDKLPPLFTRSLEDVEDVFPDDNMVLVYNDGDSEYKPELLTTGHLDDWSNSGRAVGDVPKWNGTDWVPSADLTTVVNENEVTYRENLILNPHGFWNQRLKTERFAATSSAWTSTFVPQMYLDGWYLQIVAAGITQDPDPAGTIRQCRIAQEAVAATVSPLKTAVQCQAYTTDSGSVNPNTTATSYLARFGQRIEGIRTAQALGTWGAAGAKTLTLAGKIKGNDTGTVPVCIQIYGGSPENVRYMVTLVNVTTSWSDFTIEIPGSETFTPLSTYGRRSIEVSFVMASGTDYHVAAADTWYEGLVSSVGNKVSVAGATNWVQSGTGGSVSVTNLRLTATDEAVDIVYDMERDWMELQRLYQKSYPYSTKPGTASLTGSPPPRNEVMIQQGVTSPYMATGVYYRTRMAGQPSVRIYNPDTGAVNEIYDLIGPGSQAIAAPMYVGQNGFGPLEIDAGNWGSGTMNMFHYEAESFLA